MKRNQANAAKHTPGPWTIRHDVNIFGVRNDVGHEGVIATTGGHYSNRVDCTVENRANAILIAAAPGLLAVVRQLIAFSDDMTKSGSEADAAWESLISAAREAVEKSEKQ